MAALAVLGDSQGQLSLPGFGCCYICGQHHAYGGQELQQWYEDVKLTLSMLQHKTSGSVFDGDLMIYAFLLAQLKRLREDSSGQPQIMTIARKNPSELCDEVGGVEADCGEKQGKRAPLFSFVFYFA